MRNIIEYVEQEFTAFSEKPFCDVDSLVLSQLSYIHFEVLLNQYPADHKAEIRDLLRAEDMDLILLNVRDPESNKKLLYALAASPRFRNIKFGDFVSKTNDTLQEQFAAVTFYMPDGQAYIVYRGTDSTLIGWKEDFNMAFMPKVPAQQDALDYINRIAAKFDGYINLCGHSKGGNLAIYSAAFGDAALQDRVRCIYAHDAPGFSKENLQSAGYKRIQYRIRKTIPQASLIGMLLENHDNYTVVESRQIGIMQHDPFSWFVDESGFRIVDNLNMTAEFMNNTIDDWISGMSMEERERFVDALYSVLSAGNVSNVYDLGETFQRPNLVAMYNAASNIDPETREFVFQVVRNLGGFAVQNLPKIPRPDVVNAKQKVTEWLQNTTERLPNPFDIKNLFSQDKAAAENKNDFPELPGK